MTRFSRAVPMLMVLTAAVSACPRRQEPAPPPTPTVNQDSINRENARRDSIANAERMRAEAAARERARADSIAAAEARRVAEARSALSAVIYFDFDQSELTDEARSTLDAKIPVLTANPELRLLIVGHTDERGSDEYNLALGQRRAASARRYLSQRGIAADRIEITSRGEEEPAAMGSDESAWQQNRRDEFQITAGGDAIRAPGAQ